MNRLFIFLLLFFLPVPVLAVEYLVYKDAANFWTIRNHTRQERVARMSEPQFANATRSRPLSNQIIEWHEDGYYWDPNDPNTHTTGRGWRSDIFKICKHPGGAEPNFPATINDANDPNDGCLRYTIEVDGQNVKFHRRVTGGPRQTRTVAGNRIIFLSKRTAFKNQEREFAQNE